MNAAAVKAAAWAAWCAKRLYFGGALYEHDRTEFDAWFGLPVPNEKPRDVAHEAWTASRMTALPYSDEGRLFARWWDTAGLAS